MCEPVEFIEDKEITGNYTFAIIIARYRDRWLFVRHRDRKSWELPAGHVEKDESVDQAAVRELKEETGAMDFDISGLVSYRGKLDGKTVYGKIFKADIKSIGPLPESEIAEIKMFDQIPSNLTYREIQPLFIKWYLDSAVTRK